MILVTGAAGKTGLALLRELTRKGLQSRALVRSEAQLLSVLAAGATTACRGDLLDPESLRPAFKGVASVYHIPPNVHPQEAAIGEHVLHLAQEFGVEHFVYHSVLHPYIRGMPHHLKKAEVEERIFASGLPFTILQPDAYMQNYLPALDSAKNVGTFPVPYPVETRLGVVDLSDVVQAAGLVIGRPEHYWATYELSAGETWTPAGAANLIGQLLQKSVLAVEIELDAWAEQAERSGMDTYRIETLVKMFEYYAQYGFGGNSRVLAGLLGRPPSTFREYLSKAINQPSGA